MDGNGSLETTWTPIYDSTGNLVQLTDGAGKVTARYDYAPFGESVSVHVDDTAPCVDQVIVIDGEKIRVSFCEEIVVQGIDFTLSEVTPPGQSLAIGAKSVQTLRATQTQQGGPVAGRQVEIVADILPAEGTTMRLEAPPASIVDRFGNPLPSDISLEFAWPAAASGVTVLEDTASPEVERVWLDESVLEITFSEDLGDVAIDAITLEITPPGQSLAAKSEVDVTWVEQAAGTTVRVDGTLPAGTYTLTIVAGAPVDLAANPLAQNFTAAFEILTQATTTLVFEKVDPTETMIETVVNRFGFHGRPLDLESGLLYFRNRYFDPKMGRFVSADPLGYVDGPSMYQGFGNSPLNHRDPLGHLTVGRCFALQGEERDSCEERQARAEADLEVIINETLRTTGEMVLGLLRSLPGMMAHIGGASQRKASSCP